MITSAEFAGQMTGQGLPGARAVQSLSLTYVLGPEPVSPRWPRAAGEGRTPQASFTSASKEPQNCPKAREGEPST